MPLIMCRWQRIVLRIGIVLLVMVGLLALAAQLFVAPQIKSQLIAAVEDHLHATLTIGKIRYRIPFTVHLYNVHLIGHPENHGGEDLLSASQINLSLASLPLGKGPVVIEHLAVIDPAVHVVREPDGKIAGLDLIKPEESQHPRGPIKLSDLLRLRRFSLRNGSIALTDETPDAPLGPTEWRNINSDMTLTQNSASLYFFHFTLANGGVAGGTINGSFDVDSLQLKISRFAASVQANSVAGQSQTLPPELRDLLQRFDVGGSIAFSGAGDIPLKSPENATFTSELSLTGAKATAADGLRLDDLRVKLTADRVGALIGGLATTRPVTVKLSEFDAKAGGASLRIRPTTAHYEPQNGHWSLNGITGSFDSPVNGSQPPPWGLTGHSDFHVDVVTTPHDGLAALLGSLTLANISIRPPGVEPVSGLTGRAELGAVSGSDGTPVGAIVLHDVSVYYGKDHWLLNRAQIPLAPLPGRIQIDRIDGQMQFASPPMHYPGDMGDVMDQLRPGGPFTMTGTGAMQWTLESGPHYSPLWELTIKPDISRITTNPSERAGESTTSSLTLLDGRLPLTQIVGELLLTKHAFDLRHLSGRALGGDMNLSVDARVADPVVYQGKLTLTHASIEQAAALADDNPSAANLPTGDGDLTLNFFSRPAALSTTKAAATRAASTNPDAPNETLQALVDVLGGDGKLHVTNGNLWSVPAFKNLTGRMKLAKEAFTAGEGGGVFSIINRSIYIRRGAVNMPAIGLDGSGTVTFTRQLNVDVIAAPLGNWRHDLEQTGIPIVSGAMAVIAGGLERAVNGAQMLLYQFRISGSADNPKVIAVPTPFLTNSAAAVFAAMLHPGGQTQFIDTVNEQATTAPADPSTTPSTAP